jgi:hypothetical protein
MCEHDLFGTGSENQAVFSDNLAAAQGSESDRAGFSCPCVTVAP